MVNDVDQNDNGMIEFNEFLQMMSKKMREGDSEDELREAFKWVILNFKVNNRKKFNNDDDDFSKQNWIIKTCDQDYSWK